MTYLVRSSYFEIKECKDYDEVLNLLRKYTAFWCADSNYEGEDFETLFKECLENKDFGDIAQVFEIDTYFLCGNKNKIKIPCELYCADKNIPFKIIKIF